MRDGLSSKDLREKLPLKLVDLGVGMPAALVSQMLCRFGATATRIEPASGDPFYEVYPAYRYWRSEADGARASLDALDSVLETADVCILGGERFPGLDWSFDAQAIAARFPRLVVLEISGYATKASQERPSVEILVQARTGVVNDHFTKRPIALAFPVASYGAALIGLLGVQAALVERERSGRGQLVRTSLQEGVALWTSGGWTTAERPDASFQSGTPKDVGQPIFRCGDGRYLMLTFGTPGSLATIYRVLGVDIVVDPNDRNLPNIKRGARNFFCDRDILEPAFAKVKRDETLAELWKGGVAADAVNPPGHEWDSPQAQENEIIEKHPDGVRAVASPLGLRAIPGGSARPQAARSEIWKGLRPGPLSGLRIVDLGGWVAGPYGAKLLGDLGAEIIKVELVEGEPFRPMYRQFASANRGKRSLAIDLKAPEGLSLIQRLCATADAVTHNMRVGVAERLGVDPNSLRKLNPRIVTMHSSAFGASGPKALNSGWDPVLQAFCGHSVRAGGVGNDPLVYSLPILDYGAGILGAIAMLIGVRYRNAQNASADLESNLFNVGLYLLSELVREPDGGFVGAPVLDRDQTGLHPAESLYQTRDGWIALAARSPAMADKLAHVLTLDLGARAGWGDKERSLIAQRIRERNSGALLSELEAGGVWAEACTGDAWLALGEDAEARAAGLFAEREDSHYGQLTGIGQLLRFSRSHLDPKLPPIPASGEDTRALMSELGLGAAEIDALYAKRVIA